MSTTPLLAVEKLRKHYLSPKPWIGKARPPIQAVDDVSFTVERGETLALVGESGCGKTTTAKSVVRLVEPTSGSVRLEGEELTTLSAERMRQRRKDLQIVFQDPVRLARPAPAGGRDRRRAAAQLRRHDRRRAAASGCSGCSPASACGPSRRPSIRTSSPAGSGSASASPARWRCNPKLIVCDEPVSALDVSVQAQVVNLLMDLQAELGIAYLFVAHDLAVVRHISHRVAVMYLGQMMEVADRDTLFAAPRHPYTEILLSAVPVPNPRIRPQRLLLQGDPPSPANPPPGCRFHTRCPLAQPVCREERPPLTPRDGRRRHAVGGLPLPLNQLVSTRTCMSTTPTYDLLIRGGTVIDGTKAPRFDADVGVRDGRIAAVGDLAGASAARTIDAAGLIVAPGFIDSHTHDDQALLRPARHGFKVSQGVTTVIAGNCGISAAPLVRGMKLPMPLDLLDVPDGERHETFAALGRGAAGAGRRRPTSPRWSATRRCAPRPWTTSTARPAPQEIAAMQALLVEALDAGAIGLSTGTFYPPAVKASTEEIIEVGRPLDGARRPLRHAHARRVVEGDGGAGRDLPHRPRAGHSGRGLAPQGAEQAELRPLDGDARLHPRDDEGAAGLPRLLSLHRRLDHDPHRPRHARRPGADRLERAASGVRRPRARRRSPPTGASPRARRRGACSPAPRSTS